MGSSAFLITNPPEALRKAKLDNIALVPASLLPLKGTYQPLANKLPKGSILCVSGTPRQQKIIATVTKFFRDHGRQAITLPVERLQKRTTRPKAHAETLRLAL